jgi:hypothetical protein
MSPERWKKLEGILLAALAQDADIRPAFLDTACGADLELRRELESFR